jgi:4-oxalocrotonate tautomerase family enzyme
MPTLEVFLPEGRAEPVKASLIFGLTRATVDAIGAPAESVRILLNEMPAANFGIGGMTALDGAPPSLPVIFVILIAGRTEQQKRALIAALSETSAAVLDAPAAAIRVMIKDIPNTDFGIAGETAKALGR